MINLTKPTDKSHHIIKPQPTLRVFGPGGHNYGATGEIIRATKTRIWVAVNGYTIAFHKKNGFEVGVYHAQRLDYSQREIWQNA